VLDVVQARRTVEDCRTAQAVTVLRHFEGFAIEGSRSPAPQRAGGGGDGEELIIPVDGATPVATAAGAGASSRVQDTANFLPFMRAVSVAFSLTGGQLLRLAMDLPECADALAPNVLRHVAQLSLQACLQLLVRKGLARCKV
jgi:hypothetical protein